jgi:hypothetical protein
MGVFAFFKGFFGKRNDGKSFFLFKGEFTKVFLNLFGTKEVSTHDLASLFLSKKEWFLRHGFFVLDKMSKTFHAKFERFKKGGTNGSYGFGKGFGRRKKMKRKIMRSTIVFDVLQERIKEMPVFFRKRGSERFNRGELWGEGFGGRHKDSRSVKQKKQKSHLEQNSATVTAPARDGWVAS